MALFAKVPKCRKLDALARMSSGRKTLQTVLCGGDYICKVTKPNCKVILSNVTECAENPNITILSIANAFKGTGHIEWEWLMADFIVRSISQAYENDVDSCDFSWLFNKSFSSKAGLSFSADEVRRHLSRYFSTVEIQPDGTEVVKLVM